MLPLVDRQHLQERVIEHVVSTEAGMICVVLPRYALPAGFRQIASDLLLRLSPGYPDIPPDMWWFDPAVQRIDGREIPCTQVRERHLGREWQRWSRHLDARHWRSGVDSIESFLAVVRRELNKAMGG